MFRNPATARCNLNALRRSFSSSIGIVGLPNVGKSTLFNALTRTQLAQAANFPFCTIEPNSALVAVPDDRLERLARIAKSVKVTPTQVKFVDVAGLVKGAHKGEGLGNQFLANIREVAVVLHVLRCFSNPDIVHVDSSVDPVRDMDVIETELMLADLQSVEKRLSSAERKKRTAKGAAKEVVDPDLQVQILEKAKNALNDTVPLSEVTWTDEEYEALPFMQLLTSKPMAYVLNVDEASAKDGNEYTKAAVEHLHKRRERLLKAVTPSSSSSGSVSVTQAKRQRRALSEGRSVVICAGLESEAAANFGADQSAMMEYMAEAGGVTENGLSKVTRLAADLLDLQCYYTVGQTEARAWSITRGATAQEAAGQIHTDMAKGFICAEVIKPDVYFAMGGDAAVKAAGKVSQEGKNYLMQDGDICFFKFNVTRS